MQMALALCFSGSWMGPEICILVLKAQAWETPTLGWQH